MLSFLLFLLWSTRGFVAWLLFFRPADDSRRNCLALLGISSSEGTSFVAKPLMMLAAEDPMVDNRVIDSRVNDFMVDCDVDFVLLYSTTNNKDCLRYAIASLAAVFVLVEKVIESISSKHMEGCTMCFLK